MEYETGKQFEAIMQKLEELENRLSVLELIKETKKQGTI